MIVDKNVFVRILADTGYGCADAAIEFFHIGFFVVAGRENADHFHSDGFPSKGLAQNGHFEAARIPDSVSRHEGALCASLGLAQNGHFEAARIPDSVSRHESAL